MSWADFLPIDLVRLDPLYIESEKMSELDPWKHADFIYACYLVVGFSIALLAVWIFRDERKQNQLLAELEEQSKT